jgi:hypothetical protein
MIVFIHMFGRLCPSLDEYRCSQGRCQLDHVPSDRRHHLVALNRRAATAEPFRSCLDGNRLADHFEALEGGSSRVRYIDSLQGCNPSFGDWLLTGFNQAVSVAIRTGFLSAEAVDQLEPAITAFVKRGGELLIVAGGAPDQADTEALVKLAELLRPHSRTTLRVIVSPEEFQNAKTYHMKFPDGHSEALVGSPNLTLGGIAYNHEAAILLDSRNDSEAAIVATVLHGIEAFRDRAGSTPVTDDTLLLLAGHGAVLGRRAGRTSLSSMRATMEFGELLESAVDRVDAVASGNGPDLPTGFTELDDVTDGLSPGTLTVIGSRPGIGSSTLLLDIVRHASIQQGQRTALFCLDRHADEVIIHILSAEAKIRRADMRGGKMSDEDWTRLAARIPEIADAPLLINATPGANLPALCEQITQLHRTEEVRLLAIDPINMIDPGLPEDSSREHELSAVARRLKLLALELHIPIVTTAALGRKVEQRLDRRPTINDLRDSDTLGQVSDNVILMHRPDAYEPSHPRNGEADLYLVKHRNGPARTITVAQQLHIGRFATMTY